MERRARRGEEKESPVQSSVSFDPHETLVEAHPKQEIVGDNHEIQIQ